MNNRLQSTEIDQNPGGGISDSALTPIQFGWHFKRADAIAAYNMFIGKNKSFALGPEVSLPLARGGLVYGSVKVNYQWESYARTATQGSEFTILATFMVPPIKLPGTP